MKRVTSIATACVAAVLLALSVSVGAQDFNTLEKTYLTFSNPVELPGMTLPAGTYTFRLADTPTRNVIQVLSQDEMEVKGQFLFVQAQRPEVTGETVITFRETREGTTPAVQFWYYPGEKIGKEFIYPKDQAMRIAQRTGAGVMTEDGRIGADGQVAASTQTTTSEPASVQAEASVSAPAQETAVAVEAQGTGVVEGSGLPAERTTASADANVAVGTSGQANPSGSTRQEGTMAQANTTANMQNNDSNNNVASELPATASPLALSGLLGLLSLMGAAGIRAFRQ